MSATPCLSEAAELFLKEPPVQQARKAVDLVAEIGDSLGELEAGKRCACWLS
jgi:hypothetical protein